MIDTDSQVAFTFMAAHISEASLVVGGEEAVSCDLAGGAALLDLRSSTYYSLNEVGSQVWALIQEPIAVSEIRDALLARYDVEAARCYEDLLVLLKQLADAGLINVTNSAHP